MKQHWMERLEVELALPVLTSAGSRPKDEAARELRGLCVRMALDDWPRGFARTVRAAIRRNANDPVLASAGFWIRPNIGLLKYLVKIDKAFWLRVAAKTEDNADVLERTSSGHAFTKKDLLPLLSSVDPAIRMLGLRLMAGTLPDAKSKSAPVRVRSR